MPVYDFTCKNGHHFDRFMKIADLEAGGIKCICGAEAEQKISAPMLAPMFQSYQCPITGEAIESKRAHENNLAKHDCRILEPGERDRVVERRKEEDRKLDASVERTAEEFIEKLPVHKKEQLANEMAAGIDVKLERQTYKGN